MREDHWRVDWDLNPSVPTVLIDLLFEGVFCVSETLIKEIYCYLQAFNGNSDKLVAEYLDLPISKLAPSTSAPTTPSTPTTIKKNFAVTDAHLQDLPTASQPTKVFLSAAQFFQECLASTHLKGIFSSDNMQLLGKSFLWVLFLSELNAFVEGRVAQIQSPWIATPASVAAAVLFCGTLAISKAHQLVFLGAHSPALLMQASQAFQQTFQKRQLIDAEVCHSCNVLRFYKGAIGDLALYLIQIGFVMSLRLTPYIVPAVLVPIANLISLISYPFESLFYGQLMFAYLLFGAGLCQRHVIINLREQAELCFAFGASYQITSFLLIHFLQAVGYIAWGVASCVSFATLSHNDYLSPIFDATLLLEAFVRIPLSDYRYFIDGLLLIYFVGLASYVRFPTVVSHSDRYAVDWLTTAIADWVMCANILYAKAKLKERGTDIFTFFVAKKDLFVQSLFSKSLPTLRDAAIGYAMSLKERNRLYSDSRFPHKEINVFGWKLNIDNAHAYFSAMFLRIAPLFLLKQLLSPAEENKRIVYCLAWLKYLSNQAIQFIRLLLPQPSLAFLAAPRSFLQENNYYKTTLLPPLLHSSDAVYHDKIIQPLLMEHLKTAHSLCRELLAFRNRTKNILKWVKNIDVFFTQKKVKLVCWLAGISAVTDCFTLDTLFSRGEVCLTETQALLKFLKKHNIIGETVFNARNKLLENFKKHFSVVQKIKNGLPEPFLEDFIAFLKEERSERLFQNAGEIVFGLLKKADPELRKMGDEIFDEFDFPSHPADDACDFPAFSGLPSAISSSDFDDCESTSDANLFQQRFPQGSVVTFNNGEFEVTCQTEGDYVVVETTKSQLAMLAAARAAQVEAPTTVVKNVQSDISSDEEDLYAEARRSKPMQTEASSRHSFLTTMAATSKERLAGLVRQSADSFREMAAPAAGLRK